MATIEEANAKLAELNAALEAMDLKLDEVRAFIANLQANQPVTQAQLDELTAMLGAAKEKATAVLGEADALDGA